jgi:stage V sporulation protein B
VSSHDDKSQLRNAGRGGLALSFAKVYFVILGLGQQVVLSWLLRDAYGALRGALSPASVTYNAAVSASVFGMSRAVSQASPDEVQAVIRRGLLVHAGLGAILGIGFWCGAGMLGTLLNSAYLVPYFRWLSVVIGAYTVYAALVGVLNGQRRFVAQAVMDVIAATLRTIALIVGAYLAARGLLDTAVRDQAVSGAVVGFAVMSVVMALVCGVYVGVGSRGTTRHSYGRQLHFVLPVMGAQFLLNLLLQADTNTLRAAATRAAESVGLPVTQADLLVGSYNAGQLYAFLPYQLLTAMTFLLFPLLASAHATGDHGRVKTVVDNGCRVTLLVVGLVVSVTAALPHALLRLVFPPQFADVGAASMQILSLGMGSLALFGVFGAILNGLGKQWLALVFTALGVLGVLVLNLALVRGTAFGAQLLVLTATATSVAVAATCVAAGFAVWSVAKGGVALLGLVRVAAAIGVCVAVGRWLSPQGRVTTLLSAAALVLTYLVVLVATRELRASDWRAIRVLTRRQ